MESRLNYSKSGEVLVDECFIGGEERQNQGRSKGKKKLVIATLEKPPFNGDARAYAQIIENGSSASFLPFFEARISKDAEVITDE